MTIAPGQSAAARTSLENNPILFYVVDWLPPDFGAVGQYGLVFAQDLARAGRRVCLIGLTSEREQTSREPVGSGILEIVRVSASHYDKTRLASRLIWTLRANTRLLWEVIRRPESRGAELLFTGAPPFFLYFAFLAKLLRRMRLTYRITDFYPEVLIAEVGRRSLLLRALERFTWFMRRRVDSFEALGEDQRRILIEGRIPPARINLKRDRSPVVISGTEQPLLLPPELAGLTTLLYSGNYGVAHEVDTVIAGLVQHHRDGSGRVGLWLNAAGRNVDKVEAALRTAGVPCARNAIVPLDRLAALLMSADGHLITLRPNFAGLALPSKVYACIASKRPVIFVGPRSSDVHLLCAEHLASAYVHVEPGDVSAFAAALEMLADRSRGNNQVGSIGRG